MIKFLSILGKMKTFALFIVNAENFLILS